MIVLQKNIHYSEQFYENNPKFFINEVKKIFTWHYNKKYYNKLNRCYKLVKKLYEGKLIGYKACNTEYHDLKHILNAFISAARLIDGYNLSEKKLPPKLAINILIAVLLHDTGYIQDEWDNEGTGAKFTVNHIGRSIAFLVKNSREFDLVQKDVEVITKLIRCTALKVNLKEIPFSSHEEKIAGAILGTADFLGQMSDRVYIEKLLFLYREFKEAGIPGYETEFDIIKKTVDFINIILNSTKRTKTAINRYNYSGHKRSTFAAQPFGGPYKIFRHSKSTHRSLAKNSISPRR